MFLRKGICPFHFCLRFQKKGVEIHRTLEWKLKRDVATVPSEMVRSLAQEERVDPYHLDLVLLPLLFFFNNTELGSSPTSIE